tara:strand:- start:438 stop:629 length:192 start_codon:yes stop_codon:yes gene_type:complete
MIQQVEAASDLYRQAQLIRQRLIDMSVAAGRSGDVDRAALIQQALEGNDAAIDALWDLMGMGA